ncbi:MAG: phage portal protein [Patescibacteria group bacterium]
MKNFFIRCIDSIKNVFGFKGKRSENINAGKTGRLSKNWRPKNRPFNLDIRGKENTILGRSRFLEFNSTQLNSMLNAIDRNVPRTGILMQSKIKNSKGELSSRFNNLIEKHWKCWTRKEFCDVREQSSFNSFQNLIMRRVFVDGGCFVKYIYDMSSKYPLKLQLLEIDLLDITRNDVLPNGHQIVAGIEINSYRKVVAYWMADTPRSPYHDYSLGYPTSKRIPVSEIKLIFRPFRIEQLHPLPVISTIILKLNDLLEIDENELTKEKLQTALSAIIIKNDAYAIGLDSSENTDSDGDTEELFKAGGVAYLEPGEDIKTLESGKKESGYKTFNKVQERNASKAVGLSAEQTTGDLSEVNYSSARTGGIEDEKFFKLWQIFLVEEFCQTIAEKFVDMLYLMGILITNDFISFPYKYYEFLWLTPGNEWIDPLKQAQSDTLLISRGLKSRRRYFASLGTDYDEEMDNIQAETEDLKKRKLDFMLNNDKEGDNIERTTEDASPG